MTMFVKHSFWFISHAKAIEEDVDLPCLQLYLALSEPRHVKTCFAKTKAVTANLISAFVLATRIVQSLVYLNRKFIASRQLLCLYSPVCVGPGRKPRRQVFS